jgi:tRNA threonylcarbamoyladenosine biosynthesis protein TsaE
MTLQDEDATARLGAALAKLAKPGDVVTLSGPLGVGKTALARGFIEALGHAGEVPSPSFSIVQLYDDVDPPVWHVDLYRIEHSSELEELGLDAAGHGVALVEWPDVAGSSAWPDALRLSFEFAQNGARRLTAHVPPAWEERWPPR